MWGYHRSSSPTGPLPKKDKLRNHLGRPHLQTWTHPSKQHFWSPGQEASALQMLTSPAITLQDPKFRSGAGQVPALGTAGCSGAGSSQV